MIGHGRAAEYLDGTLDAAAEAAFLEHAAACAACQADLAAEAQLRDREDALREQAAARAAAAPTAAAPDAAGPAGAPASDPSHDPRGVHADADAYLEGALDPDREGVFLAHLPACAACRAVLHADTQLRDREDSLREAARARRATTRRSAWLGAGVGLVALAAGVALVLRPRDPLEQRLPPADPSPPVLVVAAERAAEIRLAYRLAAPHRPYATTRGAVVREPIAPGAVEALARASDCQGVGAAYILAGEHVRAEDELARCPATPDVDADRAGLAVLRGDPMRAIELTARALEAAPDHPVALWNRGLALHALGLERSAAAAFERVAALDAQRAPAWAAEARERGTAIRTAVERGRQAYLDVEKLGRAMVLGGPPLPPALARQVPARARVLLHDAIRTATTPARLAELAPLAAALDGLAGTGVPGYVERARAALSPARTAASAAYARLFAAKGSIDDDGWASLLARAVAARDDDLLLGAQIMARRPDGAEALAAATRDPWFELGVELVRIRLAISAGRIEETAARLAAAAPRCPASEVSYRCLQVALERARLARDRHLPAEARAHALIAFDAARRLGEWPQRDQAVMFLGTAEWFGGSEAAADAYFQESGTLDACGARTVALTTAELLLERHRLARARARVLEAPSCPEPPDEHELTLHVRLARAGHPTLDRAALDAALDAARAAPERAHFAAYHDLLKAWIALDGDPGAGDRMLRAAEAGRALEGALGSKMLADAHGARFADAARRGAWREALAEVARARAAVEPPARCALAFGGDDFRFAAVALGPDGALAGVYEPDTVRGTEWIAPEPLRRRLSGCADVAVLALPPWLGLGPVLEPDAAFHYVLGPARAPADGPRRHLVVADPQPPAAAGLAPLAPRAWPSSGPGAPDELLLGLAATPERVIAAMADATLVELHGHATWLDKLDPPVLALSPGARGWALGAAQLRAAPIARAPVVVLADCAGGVPARGHHEAWGLPLALRQAGARAVIASLAPIPDRDAAAFFDAVVAELKAGTAPAVAVARVRAEKMRGAPSSWMRHVVVFE